MADTYYKVTGDTALPRAVRVLREDEIEGKVYEETGVAYRAGDVVSADNISPSVDVDSLKEAGLLEDASESDYEAWASAQSDFSVFIPEHEAERYAQKEYGHTVVEREQVLNLRAAGADAAKSNVEASKADGADERPSITEQKSFVETPALADVSRGDVENVPQDAEDVPEEALEGVEQPPGLSVGKAAVEAEGGEAPAPATATRRRPGTRGGSAPAEGQKSE